jgi:hypothetical protein
VESALSVAALLGLVIVVSTLIGRLLTRSQGSRWVWDHSSAIGWLLLVLGLVHILFGFIIDRQGGGMSTKLALGSLLLLAGLWLIW